MKKITSLEITRLPLQVPEIYNNQIVNKRILYSDKILSRKKLECVSIPNIDKYSFEKCLERMFKSNSGIVFDTIQYSQKDKKLYFYATEKISTLVWDHYINITSELANEIKNILSSEKNKDNDCISLYDFFEVIKEKRKQYEGMRESWESHFEHMINSKYKCSRVVIYDFDYDKKELCFGFYEKNCLMEDPKKIVFVKENEKIVIKESETPNGNMILNILGNNSLLKLYEIFLQYEEFCSKSKMFSSENARNHIITVYPSCLELDIRKNGKNLMLSVFRRNCEYYYGYVCEADEPTNTLLSLISGKEDEIFQKTFVEIKDCPEWSQTILYQKRQEQLEEQKRQEQIKQKIKEFRRYM